MKLLHAFSILMATTSASAFAKEIASDRASAQTDISRVVQLFPLVDKYGIRVAIAVKDIGGSTDVSPTQNAYFTLYAKGEMFSTDATFDLGPVFAVKSAKRVSGGKYSVVVETPGEDGNPTRQTLRIDAIEAIRAIQTVTCPDFDCEASANFAAKIQVE